MQQVKREQILALLSMKECIQAVEQAYRLFSAGKITSPLRSQMIDEKNSGSYLSMPAFCQNPQVAMVKLLNVFPQNTQKNLPTIHSEIVVMNPVTGEFELLLDGNTITQLRTGAASGVAIQTLACREAKIGAAIGTGEQSFQQVAALLAVTTLQEIRISGRNFAKTKQFVEKLQAAFGTQHPQFIAVQTGDEAVSNADVIITVTASKTPVFQAENVKAGAIISAIGSFQPEMQELPSALLTKASKIYFDSTEAVLSEAGDVLVPLAQGLIQETDFTGEIGQLLNGQIKGRENEQEIIIFKSVGIAAQDLLMSAAICEKLSADQAEHLGVSRS